MKKREKRELERIAKQLASVKLLALAGEEALTLKATAVFASRTCVIGEYEVSVGIKHAMLHLDHPSFDREHPYQASLPKESWSQDLQSINSNRATGKLSGKLGAKIGAWFHAGAEGEVEKASERKAKQIASAPYPIVSATPTGWHIGTELGDPRPPQGALPDGLEHCLNGEYLSGRQEEQGDGYKEPKGTYALCLLKPKLGGNDPRIRATLVGATGSLRVAVRRTEKSDALASPAQALAGDKEHEDKLRLAFVEICLARAEEARSNSAQMDSILSGEVYLCHHEIHSPRLPTKSVIDIPPDQKG